MKSLAVLFLFVAAAASQGRGEDTPEKAAYDKLYVTFGKFDSLPKTTDEATKQGWILTRACSDNNYFAGNRYVLKGDTAVMLLFGANGQVAGMQMGVPRSQIRAKKETWTHEGDMYVMTAYFRDPGTICKRTQTSESFGDRLVILNGCKHHMIEVPFKEEDLAGTKWVAGMCFPMMGQHYWYNISRCMDCNDFYPVFLLYNNKRLDGFGWNTNGQINSTMARYEYPTPNQFNYFFRDETLPKCLTTAGPLTTQHVYMRLPYTIKCPAVVA